MNISKDKNPLHYQLYTMGNGATYEPTNFCLYSRTVVKGFLMSIVLVLLGVLVGLLVMEPIASTALWLLGSGPFITFFQPNVGEGLWIVNLIVLAVGIFIFVAYYASTWYDSLKMKADIRKSTGTRGFTETAFSTWHDKICYVIKFDKED